MPSRLDDLKAKWFLPLSGDVLGVPQERHPASTPDLQLSVSTDGNTVEMLIDGNVYMERWYHRILELADEPQAEAYYAGWKLTNVYPLGLDTGMDALNVMDQVFHDGVPVYVLLSNHLLTYWVNGTVVNLLRGSGNTNVFRDTRSPPAGSIHQKLVILKSNANSMAMLGSMDLAKERWDTVSHAPSQAGREGKPSHDTGVAIRGPAVTDLEICFRERWNDSSRTSGLDPNAPLPPLITTPPTVSSGGGTHSVQVLRTYGIADAAKGHGYSWSSQGEFTIWASYLNAIRKASKYIYIEDQFFWPQGYPPRFSRTSPIGRDVDIVYQLGEAIKRGVDVGVVTPSNAEDMGAMFSSYQRDIGVNYLREIADLAPAPPHAAPGKFFAASLHHAVNDVYLHSKLMIVDDELVLIGSANIGERSMTFDTEVHVAIVDANESFPREFRKAIWSEHTALSGTVFDDPKAAFTLFKDNVALPSHPRLKEYPVNSFSTFPATSTIYPTAAFIAAHFGIMTEIADPYGGPSSLA